MVSHRIGLVFLILTSFFTGNAQSITSISSFDTMEESLCKKQKRFRSGSIIEKRTLTNSHKESLGKLPAVDSIKFKFVILDDGSKFAWSKTKFEDILQFEKFIYTINHYSKNINIEPDSTSEYCENLNYGISNDFIESKSCFTRTNFQLESFSQSGAQIDYILFKDSFGNNSKVTNTRIHEKIRDSIKWYSSSEVEIGGIVYKMKYEFVDYHLSEYVDSNFIEQMRTYLSNKLKEYSIVQNTGNSKINVLFDSSILKSQWNFYDLDSLPSKIIEEKADKILIFSFIGCVGCTWIKDDIGQWLDTSNVMLPVYVINVFDPLFKVKELATREKWNFNYLIADSKYVKSNFAFTGFPTVMMIDSNQQLLYKKTGYSTKDIEVIKQTFLKKPF